MTPKKYPQNLHTPQKYSFFLKIPKNIEIQNFEPKKIARTYVCVKISECPPRVLYIKLFSITRVKVELQSCPEVIRLSSCSTQLSTKFQLLLKTKIRQMKKFLALSISDVVYIMLINVKMPTIVGILTFMSRIDFVLS